MSTQTVIDSPVQSETEEACIAVREAPHESTLKKSKRKNRVLAVVLGFFFGPFGMLYFGWAVFLTTLITCFLVSLLAAMLAALFSPFQIPTEWFGFISNLFFGFWGFMLASSHNELTEANDSTRLAGTLVGIRCRSLNGWLIRVIVVTTGLYFTVMFFSEGRWIAAILTAILFIPAAIWCVAGMFMGLINWIVQRSMKREAKRIAKWAAESYPTVKSQNANSPEPDVLAKMLFEDISEESERLQKRINDCCQSIQGLCYVAAMDTGALGGLMNFRFLQFTRYMDYELQSRGFEPQSKEMKEKVLTALDLNIEGWEEVTGESY